MCKARASWARCAVCRLHTHGMRARARAGKDVGAYLQACRPTSSLHPLLAASICPPFQSRQRAHLRHRKCCTIPMFVLLQLRGGANKIKCVRPTTLSRTSTTCGQSAMTCMAEHTVCEFVGHAMRTMNCFHVGLSRAPLISVWILCDEIDCT